MGLISSAHARGLAVQDMNANMAVVERRMRRAGMDMQRVHFIQEVDHQHLMGLYAPPTRLGSTFFRWAPGFFLKACLPPPGVPCGQALCGTVPPWWLLPTHGFTPSRDCLEKL